MPEKMDRFKPGLKKKWLYLIASLLWAFAGGMLLRFALRWLQTLSALVYVLVLVSGIVLALAIYWFGFSRLARKNIHRIENMASERPCVFAFQQWSSYPLVLVMISLGIFLRKYSGLPKNLLALTYVGIGGSLLGASLHYVRKFFQEV